MMRRLRDQTTLPERDSWWWQGVIHMTTDQPSTPGPGISRRRMLKRIGAGAAIVWTVPVVTSLHTPAFAASESPCDAGCSSFRCNYNLCITGFNLSPGCSTGSCTGELGCFDALDVSGQCRNFQNVLCSCMTPCTDNSQCPECSFCLCADNGCGFSACVYCCGLNCHDSSRSRRGDRTAASR
jgi:hypothetical protein